MTIIITDKDSGLNWILSTYPEKLKEEIRYKRKIRLLLKEHHRSIFGL